MKHNYSVIIPFRDFDNALKKACNSIPNRDDIQIIIVDNSTNLLDNCTIMQLGNSNIEYYKSSPTKGAGCARNEGMKHADGEYLLFLDADDYFTESAFNIFDKHLNTSKDIIYFNATSINLSSGKMSDRHKGIEDFILSNNEDALRYKFVNPVCKLIKRELITVNNIKFQEVPAGNDTMFSVISGHYAKSIGCCNDIVYVITEGSVGSSLTRTKNYLNQESRFFVMIDWYKFLKKIHRLDLSPRVISFIYNGYRNFGLGVGTKWMLYALKNKVNIFRGL